MFLLPALLAAQMKQSLQMALGVDGNLVSIFKVKPGTKCNCICPECEQPLEAKNNNKTADGALLKGQKKAHFAHQHDYECLSAPETALHRLAKEVLLKHMTLLLPPVLPFNKTSNVEELQSYKNSFTNCKFDSVVLESKISGQGVDFQPDAILSNKDGTQVFVEFFKAHKTDLNKIEKIKLIGVNTVEINLNQFDPLIDNEINYDGLKDFLEADLTRYWLFHIDTISFMKKEEERLLNEKIADEMYAHFFSGEDGTKPLWKRQQLESQRADDRKLLSSLSNPFLARGLEIIEVYSFEEFQISKTKDQPNTIPRVCVSCPETRESKKQMDINSCASCIFHHTILFGRNPLVVVCGYKNNLPYSVIQRAEL